MTRLWSGLQRGAYGLSVFGMFMIFAIFIVGVALRYAGHPLPWVDEVVTILAAWVVFFASAFVLPWREFIAFDMVFRAISPRWQRISMVSGCLCFIGVFGWIFYALVDYVRFMRIMTTDMVELPLDLVYSIFPIFIAAIMLRLAILAWKLSFGDHEAALDELIPVDTTEDVSL